MKNVNCLHCRFRHEDNGNCTAVGGFCTAVAAAHCPLLREYLDTELTPEKIDMDHEAAEQLRQLCQGCDLDRLEELAEADKDGRVAVLPVGTGGVMLDTSYPENPRLIKRVHFAVAYVSKGIVFHQPYNIFLENIAAGYISPLSEEAEKTLEAMTDG